MAESADKEPRADVVELGASEDKEELEDKAALQEDAEELVDKPVVLAVAVELGASEDKEELVDKAVVQEDAEELVDKPVELAVAVEQGASVDKAALAVAVDKAVGLGDKAVVAVELVEKAASFKRGFNNTSN